MRVLAIILLLALVGCSTEDNNSEPNGTYYFVSAYYNDGANGGDFMDVDSEDFIHFDGFGDFISNHFCEPSGLSSGSVDLDNQILTLDCLGQTNREYHFVLRADQIDVYLPCIEPCIHRFSRR